jgi:hypothetical protein
MIRWVGPVVLSIVCLGVVAFPGYLAQDFHPFYVATLLASQGKTDSIYVSPERPSIRDIDPQYRDIAREVIQGHDDRLDTAFISPPMALVLVWPLAQIDHATAVLAWRLVMASATIASLFFLTQLVPRHVPSELAWSLGLLAGGLPIYSGMGLGQNSPLFLALATCMLFADRSKSANVPAAIIGGVLLTMCVSFKLFPIALVLPLAFLRQYWMLGVATITAAGLVLAYFVMFPGELTNGFVTSLEILSRQTITIATNMSLDASYVRWFTALDNGDSVVLSSPERGALLLVKGLVVCVAALIVTRKSRLSSEFRVALIWLALLWLTPIVWYHYLVVWPVLLLPLVQTRLGLLGIVMGIGINAVLIVYSVVDPPRIAAWVGSAVWIALTLGLFLAAWVADDSRSRNPSV